MHPTKSHLIQILKLNGITDPQVLQAIENVPREIFIPEEYSALAYENSPLPIGNGQTISQPYVVAEMTSLLIENHPQKVLEIGTGSGYQCAILAELVAEVYSIERIKTLYDAAYECLIHKLNLSHVHLKYADGRLGWPEAAPFDGIIVTAATSEVPTILLEQLADPGRLIAPLGNEYGLQYIYVLDKNNGKLESKRLDAVRFVPLLEGKS